MQCRKKIEVKKIIQLSTSEVYGTAQYIPIDEEHPKVPNLLIVLQKFPQMQ